MNLYKYNIGGYTYYTAAKSYADAEITINKIHNGRKIDIIEIISDSLSIYNYVERK